LDELLGLLDVKLRQLINQESLVEPENTNLAETCK